MGQWIGGTKQAYLYQRGPTFAPATMILDLNLLSYHDRLKTQRLQDGKVYVWCQLRRKYVVLQPEEVVRQLLILYLIDQGYPSGRMSIERGVKVYDVNRRYDLVVMDTQLQPFLLVECKSHDVKIAQTTIDQAVLYNQSLTAPYILVTNGRHSLCARVNQEDRTASLCALPSYPVK